VSGALILIGGAVVWAAAYLIGCKIWPFEPCPGCDGSGRNAGSNRKRWGTCRDCEGKGRRERWGVRFVNRKK
jgi:hypothetical protein